MTVRLFGNNVGATHESPANILRTIMDRQLFLDTETTGLEPSEGHRMIEIACVEMINRQLTDHHFHYYLNPNREVEQGAFNVHGLTRDFLQDKPHFENVMEEFLNYVQGAELIIHNAPFDVGFLNHELKLAKARITAIEAYCGVIDTLAMARRKFPGQRNNLDALCKRLEVDNSARTLHGALLDCELLAQVYLAMTGGQKHLFQETFQTDIQVKPQKIRQRTVEGELPVITADEEELSAHADFLKILLENNTECLWASEE